MRIFAIAALCLSAVAVPAAAKSVEVGYRDLDLTRTDHQHVLTQRLDRAARRACTLSDDRGARDAVARAQCLTTARAEAEGFRLAAIERASRAKLALAATAN